MSEETRLLMQLAGKIEELKAEINELRLQVNHEQNLTRCYTMKEFCSIMHLTRVTVSRRLSEGRYPWAKKDGKSWRFPAVEVEKITANLA